VSAARWILGRQPIVDREGRIQAYELLFRTAGADTAEIRDGAAASAQVILGALSGIGLGEVLGGHRGFVNVGRDLLFSDAVELLPREHVVLELLEEVAPDAELARRCRALQQDGFALALDDHEPGPAWEAIYPSVEVVKLDLAGIPPERIADRLEPMLRRLSAWPMTLLAEKVESRRQLDRCLDLGFRLFQGFYFARPAVLERRRVDENAATLLRLLGQLTQDAETRAIEATIRESAGLTYKLLVLVNSVSLRGLQPIGTVRQAITRLGRQQMRRWVQLALFATAERRGLDDPMLDAAATRGAFLEQLARRHPRLGGGEAAEEAFMAGVLSLVDAVYDVTMQEVVDRLHLSSLVAGALLRREGVLGQILDMVERLERLDVHEAWARMERLGLSHEQVAAAQLAAFAWRASMA
jgi:EAL and modified HD-GYP domain-containing signal transduction protein